jgi:CheY-like chemotaxis protein
MKILLIEDDVKLAGLLQRGLTGAGHAVDAEYDGEVVVLDLMLPKKSGLAVLRDLRARGLALPMIVLNEYPWSSPSARRTANAGRTALDAYVRRGLVVPNRIVALRLHACRAGGSRRSSRRPAIERYKRLRRRARPRAEHPMLWQLPRLTSKASIVTSPRHAAAFASLTFVKSRSVKARKGPLRSRFAADVHGQTPRPLHSYRLIRSVFLLDELSSSSCAAAS